MLVSIVFELIFNFLINCYSDSKNPCPISLLYTGLIFLFHSSRFHDIITSFLCCLILQRLWRFAILARPC